MSKQLRAALYTLLTLGLFGLVLLLVFIYPMAVLIFGWCLLATSIIVLVISVYKLFCLYLKD
jgi:hypothetical protein